MFALLAVLCSAKAIAGSLTVKPEVIYSTAQLKLGDEKWTNSDGQNEAADVSNSRFIKGYGGALNLEYELADRWRLGGGVGYVSYNQQHGLNQPNFNDLYSKAQLSYDFLRVGDFSAYAAGGASYHMISLNSENRNETRINPGDVQVWNYDAGVGGRMKVAENVNLGLEYRVTNPLDSDHTGVKYSAGDESLKTELTKVKLSTNEVLASLSYSL
ncbi:outer membrane protein [Oligoflexus sp.]|uniref:outer membrane protein n=1 Tax=Oligoflexus sp. TaxID=1971216 RepID=UPI002D781E4F|nr:outer membrane beta-barrel protein [Oligoflexus sp.]